MSDKFERFSLDFFASAADDIEAAELRFLSALNEAKTYINDFYLYPLIIRMGNFYGDLHNYLRLVKNYEDHWPRNYYNDTHRNTGPEKRVFYRSIYSDWPQSLSRGDMGDVVDLMLDYKPVLKSKVQDGRAAFEIVKNSIELKEVDVLPSYRNEGYLLAFEDVASTNRAFRYWFSARDIRGETLKTREVDISGYQSFTKNPKLSEAENMKRFLVQKYDDLPFPATFEIKIDNDDIQSFTHAIYPAARKVLSDRLAGK